MDLRLAVSGDPCDLPGWDELEADDFEGAESAARRALKDCVRAHGSSCREALPCLDALGAVLILAGREAEAESFLREALDISARVCGRHSGGTGERQLALGVAKLSCGRVWEALEIFDDVADVRSRSRSLGPGHPATLHARNFAAVARAEDGGLDEAVAVFREVLDAFGRVPPHVGTEPFFTMAKHNAELAGRLRGGWLGRRPGPRVEPKSFPGTAGRGFMYRLEHTAVNSGMTDPAQEMRALGDLGGAEDAARLALALCPAPGAPGGEKALVFLESLGQTLIAADRPREAVEFMAEAYSISRDMLGPGHALTVSRQGNLGVALAAAGRPAEGLMHLRVPMDDRDRLWPGDPDRLGARSNFGIALILDAKGAGAVSVLRDVLEETERLVPPDVEAVRRARSNLELAEAIYDGLVKMYLEEP
jgi:tetratricopeptide (TPR) repeat protein